LVAAVGADQSVGLIHFDSHYDTVAEVSGETLYDRRMYVMEAPVVEKPVPVIIDTDMGSDDWMAMLILLRSPKVDVKAVTVTGTGLAHIEAGTKNALDLLALASHESVPVAKGSSTPLRGSHTFPKDWRENTDGLWGLTLHPNRHPPVDKTAVDTIISVIEGSAEKVTLFAIGPLTNIASALLKAPNIKANLKMIYVMGGAVYVPGNVEGKNPEIMNTGAEWNMYIDPYSASVVFASGAPVTLIPLDATNQVPVTLDFYGRLKEVRTTPEADFFFKILTQRLDWINKRQFFFWDQLAAAVLLDESLAIIQKIPIKVVESEGAESGCTIPDENSGSRIRICTSADSARFENLILNVLNGR